MVQMVHASDTRKPYSGLSRSLVIAIDVGTTFSGVSYAILEPGEIPKIHGVTRFPGQEHVAGNSKIPSVIYYDKHGNIMAAGAEAETSGIVTQAEDESWIKAELFKLRLRPRTMQLNMNGMRLTPLPKKKTPVHVFGDYLAYLYQCTRSFIKDTHANGISLWNTVEPDIQFVLSHPNGWEGPQQTRMRNAAVYGGLVPDTDAGRARIRFVTEGEASLHACVLNGLAADVLSNPSKSGFLIADAGGGTLDISAYAIKGTAPLVIEEIAPPDCIFAGSVFVGRRAREFLEEKLKNSKYGTPDSVEHITRKFDETTKRLFRDRNELQFVPFGSPLDKDPAVGIRSGQLRLSGNEVANLFEPSVDAAVNAIKNQIQASNGIIKSIFLVGGYAASPWLFGQLQERLLPYRVTVSRPDSQTSKAVADGAIGFYCDHHVSARMSKFMYGVEFLRELDMNNPEHVQRKEKLCELPSGPKLLPDAFDCILARGVKVKESMVFTRKYCTELTSLSMLSVFEVEIWCYRGGNTVPKWINRHDDNFSTLCVVQADLSLLNGSAEPKQGKNGKKYWTIVFSVEIHFGLTEFKSRIKWMDDGKTKYGPAVIVYNERGHRIEDDDIDVYPEDDIAAGNNGSSSNRHSSSRSRGANEPNYPPSTSSRRASNVGIPDVARMDRSASKGYSPSITPSSKSAAFRSSDGDRTGSDSDRRLRADKGKEKQRDEERDRDRDRGLPSATASPVNKRSSAFGASSIARNSSSHGGGADMLSSTWNGGAAPPISSSRSPSTKTAHSRSPSVYTNNNNNNMHGGEGDYNSMHEYSGAPHGSAVDEHANDYQWDHQAPPQSAALDAILDRPRSPYVDPSRSPYGQAQGENGFDRPASAYDQYGGNNDRPRSPFVNDPQHAYDSAGGIGRSSSPFVDRPKSGVGMEGSSFFDRPKSAFGDAHQGSMFGDTGPAADAGDAGHGEPLFGDPPASVFGDTAAAGGGPAYDSWSMPQEQTPVAEAPAVTPTASKKKGKKGSTATTPVASTPASGLASKASPAFGANKSPSKSPFGQTQDTGFYDDPPPAVSPVVAHAAVSPAISGGGSMWGSKAPSPYDKKDKLPSPLNPISHVHDDPPPPAANDFDWGFDSKGAGAGTGAAGGGSGDFGWNNNADSNDFYAQDQPPAASPIPTPVEEPVVEKGVKGKKKKVTAVNAAKQAQEDEEKAKKERKKEQDEREEKERLEREEANRKAEEDRLMAEEDERLQKEIKELEEKERLEKEQKERLEKEERERKEEEDRVKSAAAAPTSLFGSSEPAGLFSGGGDDSWGSGFGAPTAFGKKKKGKATTPLSASQPSAFGVSSWSFGGAGDDTTTQAAVSSTDPPATDLAPISGGGGGIFDFASSGPNLSFGFGGSSSAFGVSSPVPVLDATTPAVDAPPEVGGNEAADGIASAEAEESKDQEEDFSASKNPKKKKKKGGAAGLEATKEETPKEETSKEDTPQEVIPDAAEPVAAEPETPVVETPTVVETTGGGKKKKKGKK